MPAPRPEVVRQALSALQGGSPLLRKAFFNVAWGFAHDPGPGQFLQQTKAFNRKLAETLAVFRKRLAEAADDDAALDAVIHRAYLHYLANTDGQIPEAEGEDPFDLLEAATRYADWLGVGVIRQDDGTTLLEVDGKKAPGPEWNAQAGRSAAWAFRAAAPAINRMRYGRDAVIPAAAFGFDENVEGHYLPNAMALADFSHLAYFGPVYVEEQLRRWGYHAIQWVEDKKTDTQAFVAAGSSHLAVCFRGTSSGKDALMDTRFLKTAAFGGRGRVHRGFNRALDSVWHQLKGAVDALDGAGRKLFVAGHSLGAALAQLAAHRLALGQYPVAAVYAYGSPRVGNPEFRDAYNELLEDKTFLHINNKDIVARVPPRILGFRHLGGGPRLFDEGHAISIMPKPRSVFGEEEELDYDELDEATQQTIQREMQEAQEAIEAATRFLNTAPGLPEGPRSKGLFDHIRPVDDHSMDEYLYKFGCAIVDEELD